MIEVLAALARHRSRSEIIRALLERLSEEVRADVGGYFTVAVGSDEIPRFVDMHAVGSREAQATLLSIEGVAYDALVEPIEGVELAPAFGRFSRLRRSEGESELFRRVWDPIQAHTLAALNSQDLQGRYLGQVALFRTGSSPEFTSRELRQLQNLQPHVQAVLEGMAPFGKPSPGEGVWLFRPSGELWMTSDAQGRDVSPDFLAQLEALARSAWKASKSGPGDLVADQFLEGALVRTVILEGEDSGVLVTVDEVEPLTIEKIFALSPRARKVVAMACRGATTTEIAERLHRSPETIRTHLKQVYAELGISSRAELVAVVTSALR